MLSYADMPLMIFMLMLRHTLFDYLRRFRDSLLSRHRLTRYMLRAKDAESAAAAPSAALFARAEVPPASAMRRGAACGAPAAARLPPPDADAAIAFLVFDVAH
jgi:hypothetical protein